MTDDKKSSSKSDLARKVWLAGLGAYGRAINTSTGAAVKLGAEANKLFEDLVEKGENLEEAVDEVVESTLSTTRKASVNVEERIQALKSKFGLSGDERGTDGNRLDAVEARLQALEDKIDHLLDTLDKPKKAAPKPRRKSASKNHPPARIKGPRMATRDRILERRARTLFSLEGEANVSTGRYCQ